MSTPVPRDGNPITFFDKLAMLALLLRKAGDVKANPGRQTHA